MSAVQIELPPKLVQVFTGEALFRGAYGGRSSAKTRTFARMSAVHGVRCAQARQTGVILCGREFQNSLEESSFAEVKEAIAGEPWLAERYDLGDKYIRTKDKRVEFVFAGLRHNLDSIKSKSRIRLLWIDEAEPVSELAWVKVIPTVREDGAEIWITWNPESKRSATNIRFRENPPADSKIIQMNWRDNPWFPQTSNKLRLEDLQKRPESYEHIWEGAYVTAQQGAYFAKHLLAARQERRIGRINADPLMQIKVFCDIGGTGAKSDAFAMWISQFIGKEIRHLNYYEAIGQPLNEHVNWLRENGYGKAHIYLPHDGVKHDMVYNVTYESELKRAGFKVTTVPNQGAGAATQRIEAVRRAFPFMWFDEIRCETHGGMEALGNYHEKHDDVRGIGLGPDHNWASHAADALGLEAIVYEQQCREQQPRARGRSSYQIQDDVIGY